MRACQDSHCTIQEQILPSALNKQAQMPMPWRGLWTPAALPRPTLHSHPHTPTPLCKSLPSMSWLLGKPRWLFCGQAPLQWSQSPDQRQCRGNCVSREGLKPTACNGIGSSSKAGSVHFYQHGLAPRQAGECWNSLAVSLFDRLMIDSPLFCASFKAKSLNSINPPINTNPISSG